MRDRLRDLFDGFEAVSLEALDERAALLRRIDNKYALSPEELELLTSRRFGPQPGTDLFG